MYKQMILIVCKVLYLCKLQLVFIIMLISIGVVSF